MSLRGDGGGDGSLPVFLFPSSLTFVASQPTSHKQLLTLYNPYDFPIEYQVLSTAPTKYSVGDPQGLLRPKCCIDIVIRHTSLREGQSPASTPQSDRFRIQIWERNNRSATGRKDVNARLIAKPEAPQPDATPAFQGLSPGSSGLGRQYALREREEGLGLTPLAVIGGIVCVLALSLPSEGDQTSPLPVYLHLTIPQKLVAAYVLGLVTMLLIRR